MPWHISALVEPEASVSLDDLLSNHWPYREYHEVDVVILGSGVAGASAATRLMQEAEACGRRLEVCVVEKGSWLVLGHCLDQGLPRSFLQHNGRFIAVVGGNAIKHGEMHPKPTNERLGALSPDRDEARRVLHEFLERYRLEELPPYANRALRRRLQERVLDLHDCPTGRTSDNRVLPNFPRMLAELVMAGKLTVLTRFEALKLSSEEGGAQVYGLHRGKPCTIHAKLVLVGAGVDGAAKLLLSSFPGSFPEPHLSLEDHGRYDALAFTSARMLGLEGLSCEDIGSAVLLRRGVSSTGLEWHIYIRASSTAPAILKTLPAGDKFVGSLGSVSSDGTGSDIVVELGVVTETGPIPVDKDAAAQGKWCWRDAPSRAFDITRAEALQMMMNTARDMGLKHYRFIDREALATNFHHGTFVKQRHVDEYGRLRLANGEPSNVVVLPPAGWADDRGPGSINPLMPIAVRATAAASKVAEQLLFGVTQEKQLAAEGSPPTDGSEEEILTLDELGKGIEQGQR